LASAVPETKYFDEPRGLIHPIIDQDGSVHELAHAGLSFDGAAQIRKTPENVEMV